jgi:hypothetical protein
MTQCIWCKESGNPTSKEHIIPEALGCPPDLVLTNGEVCKLCNEQLGFLDRALLDDFDIPACQAGVPRKRNRPPRIDSRGNMVGYQTNDGPVFAINMERHPVTTPEGVRVAAFGKSSRNIRANIEKAGDKAQISYEVSIGLSPLFARSLHKIALSSTVYFLGREIALDPSLDYVRNYVRNGVGERRIIALTTNDPEYRNMVWAPYRHNNDLTVTLRLAMLEFVVDLSPDQSVLPMLTEKLQQTHGEKGWSLLPPAVV